MFKEGKLVPGMVLLSVNREGVKGMARDQIVNIIKVLVTVFKHCNRLP